MPPAATRPLAATLSVAFELGNTDWKLAMTIGLESAPLMRTIPARELLRLDAGHDSDAPGAARNCATAAGDVCTRPSMPPRLILSSRITVTGN